MDKCYIVTYDLPEGSDYNDLYDAIKSYKRWALITDSTWAVVTDKKAVDVRGHLLSFIPSDSRLCVVRSGREGAWNNVHCDNEWLRNNL